MPHCARFLCTKIHWQLTILSENKKEWRKRLPGDCRGRAGETIDQASRLLYEQDKMGEKPCKRRQQGRGLVETAYTAVVGPCCACCVTTDWGDWTFDDGSF